MFRDPEIRAVLKDALLICGIILLSTLTRNWAMLGLIFYGIAAAATYKPGKAICTYLILTFLQMINHILMPRYPYFAVMTRLGSMVMTFALIFGANGRSGHHRLPLGTLFVYLASAALSATFGYFPFISYLKILNFAFFIIGLYVGSRNLHLYPKAISEIRHLILALILLLTYGTLLTLPFPSVAYFTSTRYYLAEFGLSQASEVAAEKGHVMLLSGITNNSQFLGPAAACCFGWLLCDMWLVKKRFSFLHLALMAPIPLICYLSRSRLALFVLVFALFVITYFCLPRARVSKRIKSTFWALICVGTVLMLTMAGISEIRNHSISKWIRKNDSVSDDDRNLGTAIVSSRQESIEMNLRDFRRNRFIGSGFQVAADTRARFNAGRDTLFSVTIEKGLIPLMILGETGILGAFTFSIFLIVFYETCQRKHYTATASLFTIYLSTNMAEATFFSPSGGGGTLWILLLVGGFVIDMQQYLPQQSPLPLVIDDSLTEDDELEDGELEDGELEDGELLVPMEKLSTNLQGNYQANTKTEITAGRPILC